MRSPWRESRGRRAAWFSLILAVLLVHALFGARVLSGVIGWNTAERPRRMEVTFAKKLQPVAPPPATAPVAAPAPAPRPARAVRPPRASAAPASAPEPAPAASDARSQLVDEALA